jgi:cytochrome P450
MQKEEQQVKQTTGEVSTSQSRGFVPNPGYVLCEFVREICLGCAVTFGPQPTNKAKQAVYTDNPSTPVLRGLPGVGVALQLHRNALEFFSKTVKRYGDRVALRVLGRHVLLLTNPADVEGALISNAADFGRSLEVKSLRPVFGDGIYSSEGDRWRKQRRVVQPSFHHDRMLKYCSTIEERMTERAGKWRHGQTLDALKEMTAFTSDVICEVIFGQEQSQDAKTIANSVSVVFENLRDELLYLSLWRKLPFPRSRRWTVQ